MKTKIVIQEAENGYIVSLYDATYKDEYGFQRRQVANIEVNNSQVHDIVDEFIKWADASLEITEESTSSEP